ncbi:MAG: DUF4886 domain-containing protein [Ruminococcaceae bacterium]|nr:DUF4886 domain-containing protein [Oscillospiraceae bacterium]
MTNILFIGNSFTYYNDLPAMLQAMFAETGRELCPGRILKGGSYLSQYTVPDSEHGRIFAENYPAADWDYIVLQDQSFQPAGNPEAFFASVDKILSCMEGHHAKLIFYSTWAYRDNTEKLSGTGMSYMQMLEGLTASYKKAAEDHGALRVRAGEAFLRSMETCPAIDLYMPDDFHPSPCGSYLAACLFFKTITGEDFTGSFLPEGVTAEQGDALRRTAREF